MDKTYEVVNKNSRDIINQVESFKEKMDKFCDKHPEYSYTVGSMNKTEEGFAIEVNVKRNEE